MKVKISKLIEEIKITSNTIEKDTLDNSQLIANIKVKYNKKYMFFLKFIIAPIYNMLHIPVEIIDDTQNVNIKDCIKY
jgi:hypothetical protein